MTVIAMGAMLGSALRYLLSHYNRVKHGLGTLLANLLGCICLAVMIYYFPYSNHSFFIVGFCGLLTTFSTFCFEIYEKIQYRQYLSLVCYCLATCGLAIILFWWIV